MLLGLPLESNRNAAHHWYERPNLQYALDKPSAAKLVELLVLHGRIKGCLLGPAFGKLYQYFIYFDQQATLDAKEVCFPVDLKKLI